MYCTDFGKGRRRAVFRRKFQNKTNMHTLIPHRFIFIAINSRTSIFVSIGKSRTYSSIANVRPSGIFPEIFHVNYSRTHLAVLISLSRTHFVMFLSTIVLSFVRRESKSSLTVCDTNRIRGTQWGYTFCIPSCDVHIENIQISCEIYWK